ncbi:MAG: hypothetical protein G8237_05755 [Magnetococcales bacterium]|nr:hypothetical protein [Magnetococcales bacterium]NGZ05845.1 hypothetical protein [Magnetococcales bacterium]
MRPGWGVIVLGVDLVLGLFFLLLMVVLATRTPHPAPSGTTGELQRLKADLAALSARLQVKEERLQGLIRGTTTPHPADLDQAPLPSLAAEWTGNAALRGEVADLSARYTAMQERLRRAELGLPEQTMVQTMANQAGLHAHVAQLQTEIARLNTRIEAATLEAGAARNMRTTLEAQLHEREQRIMTLEQERHTLANRIGLAPGPDERTPRQPLPQPRMTQP